MGVSAFLNGRAVAGRRIRRGAGGAPEPCGPRRRGRGRGERGWGSSGVPTSAMLPPSSSESSVASASAVTALMAWSLRNGSHSINAATGNFTNPSRTITIHSDILTAMLLPSPVKVCDPRVGR